MRTMPALRFLLLTRTVGGPAGLSAHEVDGTAPPGPVEPRSDRDGPAEFTDPGKWVLGSTFGAGKAGGQYGDFLEKPVNFDLNLGYEPGGGPWRCGVGIQGYTQKRIRRARRAAAQE